MPKLNTLPWTPVDSSNLGAVFFDEHSQTIGVKFLNGGLYTYMGVSEEVYMGLTHAQSMGKYLNNVLKAFPYTRWDSEQALLDHLNI